MNLHLGKPFGLIIVLLGLLLPAASGELAVNFGFKPPQWRTAICPPDDPYKTLIDEKGALLYHFNQARPSEFGTELSVVVDGTAKLLGQSLVSPRVPVVQTRRRASDLEILEEAFAMKKAGPNLFRSGYMAARKDKPRVDRNWARPPAGASAELSTAAFDGREPVYYQVKVPAGSSAVVALALCEGKEEKSGRRILDLFVEGAEPGRVDTVAELGPNVPGAFWFAARDVNDDGLLDVRVAAAKDAGNKIAFLNAFWVFAAPVVRDNVPLLAGRMDGRAALAYYVGQNDLDSRNDVVLVHVTNTGSAPRTVTPRVVVRSAQRLDLLDPDKVRVDSHETVISTQKVAFLNKTKTDMGEEAVMTLSPMTVMPGQTTSFAVTYCGGGRIESTPATLAEARAERAKAESFWKNVQLPYDRIVVPDKSIQALIDSSIRNIWQAREIKNGLPAFQVGATYYRALFIVDGAFILEAANMLGAGRETRAGIAYTLTFQQEDGRFEILPRYHKENGIVLWTCVRHAMLTQDKDWLRSVWPKLEKTVGYIKRLREESRQDASPLNDGLMPPGYPDGGIGGAAQYEYSNVYWNLLGLKAIIQAAQWLGRNDQAAAWQNEFDDFYATFRKAAERDTRSDFFGNRYLPILMAIEERILLNREEAEWYLPSKAQWAFCHGVYPGQLFAKDDSLVKGNLDMLATCEKEGMVTTTGWLTGGIWNYFASFYGHAQLWQGDGRKAAEALYAYANHASPLLAWLEEQGLQNEPVRENGDMPHNWASAEFIRLAVHLLALDRGSELHLFEGLPREWTGPTMETKLTGIATPFGPLTCSLHVGADGHTAVLDVARLADPSCQRIVVHLGRWASADTNAVQVLDPRQSHRVTIPINR
jgi:hypothetical protein